MLESRYDVVVIGAGIVGLSTAMEFSQRFPRLRLGILDKEKSIAAHQSGRNSGVIHSGIYYRPGSLKARMCVEGAAAGRLNGIGGIRQLCRQELCEIEPHCAGAEALHIPGTGITDYGRVCAKYRDIIEIQGADIRLSSAVMRIRTSREGLILETASGTVATRHVVNCAGLQSDLISQMTGSRGNLEIIPFRGEYYDLIPERQTLVRGLIYPVPDGRFPFLGVHFTRRIGGGVDAGPNAVLAFKREGYHKTDFAFKDVGRVLRFPGFWRMAAKHWRSGVAELYRSVSKSAFVRALQRLVPEITASDLVPGNAGVRAQAVRQNGSLLDDFEFEASANVLNVCNVPSPAATASIPLGKAIVQMAVENFELS